MYGVIHVSSQQAAARAKCTLTRTSEGNVDLQNVRAALGCAKTHIHITALVSILSFQRRSKVKKRSKNLW